MIVFALQTHDMIDLQKLTTGNCVDCLSLVLALSEDRDERIEDAVHTLEMIKRRAYREGHECDVL